MKPLLIALFSMALAACGSGPRPVTSDDVAALLPDRPEKGTLFRYYQGRDPSKWHRRWPAAVDLTGVAWNDPATATAISPDHVVMAAHFIRGQHTPIVFHDREGQPHERFYSRVKVLTGMGDIAVARLNRPLPEGVAWYPLANPGEAKEGMAVLVTDQTRTASVHRVAVVRGKVIAFRYADDLDPVYRRNLITGDSGNPSFLLRNGKPVLLETHTTGGPGAGPHYGDPEVGAAVRAAMAEM